MSAPVRRQAEPQSRQVRWADSPPQAWRNGGGQTRELLTSPPGADWRLRLSVADIQTDGPFSVFEGVLRWFVVLDGAGVELRIAGRPQWQTPSSAPLHFAGDAATDCRLIDGPTRDLSLMLRGCAGGLAAVAPGQAGPGATACGLFTAGAGQCRVQGGVQGGVQCQRYRLPAMSLLWFDPPPGPLHFAGKADTPTRAWWIWADLDPKATADSESPAA